MRRLLTPDFLSICDTHHRQTPNLILFFLTEIMKNSTKKMTTPDQGVSMSGKTPTSTPLLLILFAAQLFAGPVLLSEWEWNDPSGIYHEFQVFSFAGQSWEQSTEQLSTGWHLATITSPAEQQALVAGLEEFSGEYWLGGHQSPRQVGPEDDWAWLTGETWDYHNWAPGEPNDAYGQSSEQHIAVWSRWNHSDWLWNDEGYLPNISGYIAERTTTSVPEPGQLPLFAAGLVGIACMIRRRKKQ